MSAPEVSDELRDAGGGDSGPEPSAKPTIDRALLRSSTPAALIGYALFDWAVIAACWVGIVHAPGFSYPLWLVIIAGRMHGLGVLAHDALHIQGARKSIAMRVVELLTAIPLVSSLDAMRYHHLRHHRDNGFERDPYFKEGIWERPGLFVAMTIRGVLLMPFWMVRVPFGLVAAFWPALRNAYGRVFLQDKSGLDLRASAEVIRCGREEIGVALWLGGVVTLFVSAPGPVALAYLAPLSLTGILAAYRLLLEHDYLPCTDRSVETVLRSTRDHNLGWLGIVLLAPHGVGYHVAHHLHPGVGFRALAGVRRWYMQSYSEHYPPLQRRFP